MAAMVGALSASCSARSPAGISCGRVSWLATASGCDGNPFGPRVKGKSRKASRDRSEKV